MVHTVNAEIFRQIITKDNRNNLDVFDKLAQNVLKDGMRRTVLAMTDGMPDWEYQMILRPDSREFSEDPTAKYNGRAIYMAVHLKQILGGRFATELPAEKPEGIRDCDLSLIDLAGWCKLIRFRFLNEENRNKFILSGDKHSADSFMSLVTHINNLRNDISHENESTIRKYQNERMAKKVFSDLITRAERSVESVKENMRNGEALSNVLLELTEEIREFSEMFALSLNRCPIDKKSTDLYPAEYLYGFDRVCYAYPSCRNRNYYRFLTGELNPLMIRGRSNLAVDSGTLDYLSELSLSAEERQAAEVKRVFQAMDNDLKDTLSLIRLSEPSAVPIHYTDSFFAQLQNSEDSICVITDDAYLAKEIAELPENIVAVNVADPSHVTPFVKKEEERGPVPAPKEEVRRKAVLPAKNSVVCYGNPKEGLQYTLKEQIGSGGEGNIYRTDIGRECFKIYHEEKLTRKRQEKVQRMLQFSGLMEEKRVCWPTEAIYEASSRHMLVGFSMPDVHTVAKSETVTLEEMILSFRSGDLLGWNWKRKDLLNLCMEITEVLTNLHHEGILVGDLNPGNILVDREGEVFFIDTDSYQFEEYLCPVGIPEYTSPALWEKECSYGENPRTLSDEHFAMARLFYYILFLGDSPFLFRKDRIDMSALKDAILHKRFRYGNSEPEEDFIWLNLTPKMKESFRMTFYQEEGIDDPRRYPGDVDWLNRLFEMSQRIDEGILSNELEPSDAILEEGEQWTEKSCVRCGTHYPAAHHKDETLCPSCRNLRRHNETIILKVRCSKCKEIFTTSPWELLEVRHITDTEEILCPDCEEASSGAPLPDLTQILEKVADNYKNYLGKDD